MVVRRILPVALVILPVISRPVLVGIVGDLGRLLERYAEPLRRDPDPPVARGNDLHVDGVALPREHRRRRPPDENDLTRRGRLLDHPLRDPHQVFLGQTRSRAAGIRGHDQLRRGGHERPRQALDEGRDPLLQLGHVLGRESGPGRHALDQLVVHHAPAERARDARGDLGAAGAVLAGDGDQHGIKSTSSRVTSCHPERSEGSCPPVSERGGEGPSLRSG